MGFACIYIFKPEHCNSLDILRWDRVYEYRFAGYYIHIGVGLGCKFVEQKHYMFLYDDIRINGGLHVEII